MDLYFCSLFKSISYSYILLIWRHFYWAKERQIKSWKFKFYRKSTYKSSKIVIILLIHCQYADSTSSIISDLYRVRKNINFKTKFGIQTAILHRLLLNVSTQSVFEISSTYSKICSLSWLTKSEWLRTIIFLGLPGPVCYFYSSVDVSFRAILIISSGHESLSKSNFCLINCTSLSLMI